MPDQPLDLGVSSGSKRRMETPPDAHCTPAKRPGSPGSTISSSSLGNGTLYKVSEPSTLTATQQPPSKITTVVNSAAVNLVAPPVAATATAKEESREVKQEDSDSQAPSEPTPSPAASTTASTAGGPGAPPPPPGGYVHKLKKAWIAEYHKAETDSGSGSASKPGTPNRATPSPAPSSASSSGVAASNNINNNGRSGKTGAGSKRPSVNGGLGESSQSTLSSESDAEDSSGSNKKAKRGRRKKKTNSPKKAVAKPTRVKFGRRSKVSTSLVESLTDSEKESEDKDSDSTSTTISSRKSSSSSSNKKVGVKEEKKKRGRKPKSEKKEEKKRSDSSPASNGGSGKRPFSRPNTSTLKRTGESFLQDTSCYDVAPKLAKCRECRWTESQRNKKMPNIFCRFYAFRRLKYNKNGLLSVAGYCDPKEDASQEDLDIWTPNADAIPEGLSVEQAEFLLANLREDFQLIMKEEKLAVDAHEGESNKIAWKRVVQGVREMCDVCDATLFNHHWACNKCGFVVCVGCYTSRKGNSSSKELRVWGEGEKDRDECSWLLCTGRQQHDLAKLTLVQIIAGDALEEVSSKLKAHKSPTSLHLLNGIKKESNDSGSSASTSLKSLTNGSNGTSEVKTEIKSEFKHFSRKIETGYTWRHGRANPVKTFNIKESKLQYPKVAHSWRANGRVVCLENTPKETPHLLNLFRDLWGRGQPVVVQEASFDMDTQLWNPEFLKEKYGDIFADYLNVLNGESLRHEQLVNFWPGFVKTSERLLNNDGRNVVWKVKGWPTSSDEHGEILPEQYKDLMKHLPLKIYTGKNSVLNMTASLPDVFVRSDVGPRCLIIHGLGTKTARDNVTLKTHLEIADSVSILMHVSTDGPKSSTEIKEIQELMKYLDPKVSEGVLAKVQDPKGPKLGCIWQIFHPADADKIRNVLNKESGETDPLFDPIHAGKSYIGPALLKVLKDEYGIEPFVVPQFEGEALIIPAGSPRQVTKSPIFFT